MYIEYYMLGHALAPWWSIPGIEQAGDPNVYTRLYYIKHKNNDWNAGGEYLPTEILQQPMGCNAIDYNITLSLFNMSGEKTYCCCFGSHIL